MVMVQFGNWSVGTEGIAWCGGKGIEYNLPLNTITNTGTRRSAIIYEWLVEIAKDNRFTDEDIYSLNTTFVYALDFMLGQFDIPQYALLAETFNEQQNVLKKRKGWDNKVPASEKGAG